MHKYVKGIYTLIVIGEIGVGLVFTDIFKRPEPFLSIPGTQLNKFIPRQRPIENYCIAPNHKQNTGLNKYKHKD